MNISSAARGAAERKSQRTRELEELRSQGRTKSLREKLKDCKSFIVIFMKKQKHQINVFLVERKVRNRPIDVI
jgi:DNA gyrase/topoisomerase IV subunit B